MERSVSTHKVYIQLRKGGDEAFIWFDNYRAIGPAD